MFCRNECIVHSQTTNLLVVEGYEVYRCICTYIYIYNEDTWYIAKAGSLTSGNTMMTKLTFLPQTTAALNHVQQGS